MNYWPLLGILLVVAGFALRLNPMLVVTVAALATGLLAGLDPLEVIATFGKAVGEFVGKDVAVVKQVAAQLGVDLGEMNGPHRVLADLLLPEHRALLLSEAGA